MIRFTVAAVLTLSAAACGQNPIAPQAAGPELKKSQVTSPALVCTAQQKSVRHLMTRVEYLTSGEVRTALLAPLALAYAALDPAACRPADAIAHLEEFIALVNANSAYISSSVAAYFIAAAESIIGYLRPIA